MTFKRKNWIVKNRADPRRSNIFVPSKQSAFFINSRRCKISLGLREHRLIGKPQLGILWSRDRLGNSSWNCVVYISILMYFQNKFFLNVVSLFHSFGILKRSSIPFKLPRASILVNNSWPQPVCLDHYEWPCVEKLSSNDDRRKVWRLSATRKVAEILRQLVMIYHFFWVGNKWLDLYRLRQYHESLEEKWKNNKCLVSNFYNKL